MSPWHDERMEGTSSERVSALLFERPRTADSDPGRKRRLEVIELSTDDRDGEAVETVTQIARSNLMKSLFTIAVAATLALGATVARAQTASGSPWELSVLGGVNAFTQNDTSIPDNLYGVPVAAGASYRLNSNFAAEGEFTWFIPVKTDVAMSSGTQKLKGPNALAYQVGLRGSLPLATWSPYLAAGAGAITFLSDTQSDRVPQLDESQTVFALNFGGGAQIPLDARWGVRAEFREFVGFPGEDATGLSASGNADAIWLSRGVVGLDFRF